MMATTLREESALIRRKQQYGRLNSIDQVKLDDLTAKLKLLNSKIKEWNSKYFYHSFERCAHAGQIAMELMFPLIKDKLDDPSVIKTSSHVLLIDRQLDSKVKSTEVWKFIENNLHMTLQPTYFKWLVKEVLKLSSSMAKIKGVK